ncbi:cysteine desulfurase [Candidatus Woesearchaeota archaeon]|nr:cysteine desulfurase [Candidatus Woesearchaeota archaeon]|tara:strand:+ start:18802 stop:20004 length:1203 start_codon:yes stop_codon:yes gene_type:complete
MIDARKDFPILSRKVHGKKLVYLDNAATAQKPKQVIEAIKNYYENYNSNVHRAVHQLSAEATDAYDEAHEKTANFINAEEEEVIFTKNTTESINIIANHFARTLRKNDEIVLTQMEHHSNIVPWLNTAKITGAKIKYAEINKDGELDLEQIKKLITNKTKIVALAHVSNVLGTINPVKEIAKVAHDKGALVLIDGAQSVPHMPVDVKELDCDFLAFSAHKMLGPTGIGVLYGKKELLENIEPFNFGGDMIKEVTFENASWNDLPWKFEAGTPNMAGAVGLSAAIDYLKKIGMEKIREHELELTKYAIKKLSSIEGVEIYGPKQRVGVISFNLKNVHPHDVSSILDSEGVAVRGGHHCAMPLMKLLGIQGSVRASFYFYNTKEEIDVFVKALAKVKKIMGA